MPLGVFDWTGGPFLTLYIALLLIVILLGIVIPGRMRPEGRNRPVSDPEQLAYLSGGSARLAETVTARLLAAKSLALGAKGKLDILSHSAATRAETGVLALTAPLDWSRIERAVRPQASRIQSDLERAGTEALSTARKNADRIRRAPQTGETAMAVALFGTAVLAGSEFDAFHKLRAASGDGGGSGGDSGSDGGGSGCGGGGCGGCGS
ncbi:MAG: TIGR04222 domain-containing membrane protein [Sphingomonas sp.]|uniref:TIGR04222 domain-containing membrane protein n=1 Tax=Sphingomonas sp. TaxID=28214 RepID=UPI002619D679|nr:TIGR04222 domain-containing membrane protein [Sphingomonas sp.]MDK2769515.1 TIGR04222 domain-containing membrane protein [Sphingomonas sp.]